MVKSLMPLALAAFLCAGLAAALNSPQCPAGSDFYAAYNGTSPCAPYNTCMATYCTCQGATGIDPVTGFCTWGQSRPSCALNQNCTAALMPCLNKAAPDSACAVASLTNLRVALANLASGNFYNGSTTETACHVHTCLLGNNSVTDSNSCNGTALFAAACIPPFTYTGVLTISGDWTAILANLTAKEIARLAIQTDLSRRLSLPVSVLDLLSGSLIVVFSAPVSGSNTNLQTNIAGAAANPNWLNNTQTAYNSNGGQGTLTVDSIAAQTVAPTTPPPSTTGGPTPSPTPGGSQRALSAVVAAVVTFVATTLIVLS